YLGLRFPALEQSDGLFWLVAEYLVNVSCTYLDCHSIDFSKTTLPTAQQDATIAAVIWPAHLPRRRLPSTGPMTYGASNFVATRIQEIFSREMGRKLKPRYCVGSRPRATKTTPFSFGKPTSPPDRGLQPQRP